MGLPIMTSFPLILFCMTSWRRTGTFLSRAVTLVLEFLHWFFKSQGNGNVRSLGERGVWRLRFLQASFHTGPNPIQTLIVSILAPAEGRMFQLSPQCCPQSPWWLPQRGPRTQRSSVCTHSPASVPAISRAFPGGGRTCSDTFYYFPSRQKI